MIPLKLQIKNFLSYGSVPQVIDFGPYPLICLSGKNGHGKSALLDAMTWALWGQARKIAGAAKPDSQLLRLGQKHMMVMFDFTFNNQTYRIRREFAITRGGKPFAVLEFGIYNPETDTLHSLTDKTIRETQKKIESVIGLDFDAFINSAFLRQGQANEFSKKVPKERKEILASILQLQQFDKIRKKASEKSKEAHTQITVMEQSEQHIRTELEREEAIIERLATIKKELTALAKQEKTYAQTAEAIEKEKQQLADDEQQYKIVAYKVEQLKNYEQEKQEDVRTLFATWRSVHKQNRTVRNPEELTTAIEQHTKKLAQLNTAQQKHLEIKEQLLLEREKLQKRLQHEHEEHLMTTQKKKALVEQLEAELHHKQERAKEIEQQRKTINAEYKTQSAKNEQITEELKKLHKKQEGLADREEQFEKRKLYYHKWVARANMLSSERNGLEQKKHLSDDPHNPSCPLCEQNLSASRKRFLKQKFVKQEQSLHKRINRLAALIPNLKKLLITQHKELEAYRTRAQEISRLEATNTELLKMIEKTAAQEKGVHEQITALEKEIIERKKTITKMTAEQEQIKKNYDQRLEHDETYQAHQATIKKLETGLQEYVYDAASHKQTMGELDALQKQQQQHTHLIKENAQQEQRKKDILTICTELRQIKKKKHELDTALKKYAAYHQAVKQIERKINELNTNKQETQKEKEKQLKEHGRLQAEKAQLEKLKKQLVEYEKKAKQFNNLMTDYQTLATALGKDGIQALLIEDAIPEIEHEANQLLAQLTNNQAHIFIESLRDLKKGGTKETLDIKISDPMGIRPYELFSGGEAFRIDFALRIAISKLLARRAGTSLQTLIIDEGFGSQDEEGLNRLMDAIYKIQDNFAKVIIVSHLPAMKDQFPVHFLVHKNPHGSMVKVIEQG